MTERLALGITVGALNSVAVAASGTSGPSGSDPGAAAFALTHPSVVRVAVHAAPVFGVAALEHDGYGPDVLLDGFLDRVGDPVGILAEDGSTHAAADLTATAIGCLVEESAVTAGARPGAVVACHPAHWSEQTVRTQRAALVAAGLPEVTLVPEQSAAARWLADAHGPLGPGAIVVYDLGATGLTLSVVRTGEQTGPLGVPLRNTDIAGAEFDLLTLRYVLANALNGNEFDPFDPAAESELSALRDRCRNAKESLSINTATVVPVHLDPTGIRVRLVRDELEELLRGPLLTSLDLMRDAVRRAGLDLRDIQRVLLTGGGAAIPLVAELISTEFGLPVVAADAPAETSARGAALLAADLLEATVATTPSPLLTPPARVRPPAAPEVRSLDLPTDPPPRASTRKRVAIVAGAVIVLGLLAGGTVAIGTASDSGTNTPATHQDSATTGQQSVPGSGAQPSVQPVADPLTTSSPHSPGTAPPGSSAVTAPGGPAAANTGTPGQPPNTPGQSAPGQAAQPQGTPQQQAPETQPQAGPAPVSPAPQPQPQQQPSPQPQPQPTQQYPTQNQQPLPKPQAPSLPTGVLSDTIDGVGGAVGTVLQVPGQVLGGNGG